MRSKADDPWVSEDRFNFVMVHEAKNGWVRYSYYPHNVDMHTKLIEDFLLVYTEYKGI